MAAIAQHYLDRLARSRSTVPAVRLEAAQGLLRLAEVQGGPRSANLGQPELERAKLTTAMTLLKGADDIEANRTRARIWLESADVAEFVEEDEPRARRDLASAKVIIDRDDRVPPDIRVGYFSMVSIVERWSDHWPQAKVAADQALSLLPHDEQLQTLLQRAELLQLVGDALGGEGDKSAAISAYRQSVAVAERCADLYPGNHVGLRHRGTAHFNLGIALTDVGGQSRQALALLERSAREKRAEVAFDPDDTNAQRSLRIVQSGLEKSLMANGYVNEGLTLMQGDVAELRTLWHQHPREVRRMRDTAEEVKMLADAQSKYGQVAEGCDNYRESQQLFETMDRLGRLSTEDRQNQLGVIAKRLKQIC